MKPDKETMKRIKEIKKLQYERADIPDDRDISKYLDMNDFYNIEIYLYREPGMRSSKQYVGSNSDDPMVQKLSIMTVLTSFMQTLQDKNILDEDDLKSMVEMSARGHRGELE